MIYRDKSIGKKIKEARRDAGLTREDLSKHLEISQQQIYNYENKLCNIPEKRLEAIAAALNKSLNYFTPQKNLLDRLPVLDEPKAIEVKEKPASYGEPRPWAVDYVDLPVGAGVTSFSELEVIGKFVKESKDRIDFAIQVKGDSMEPEIKNGALAFVKSIDTVWEYNGDGSIYICCDNDAEGEKDWMIRRVFSHKKPGGMDIILKPNKGSAKIYSPASVKCIGKVVAFENNLNKVQSILAGMIKDES